MKIKNALAQARALLQEHQIPNPQLDAAVLLCYVLACDKVRLLAYPEKTITTAQHRHYQALIDQRIAGQPVAYLVGSKEFMGLDFIVTPAVLIPRPDTELMVETALQLLAKTPQPQLIDVGTGSGAVAISLAHYIPSLQITATDIAPTALAVAQANASKHGVADRVKLIEGDLLAPLLAQNHPPVDIITANLPYIPSPDIPGLAREVHREPLLALDGGPDGLDLYRTLIPQATQLLKPTGHLLIEITPPQAPTAPTLAPPPHWQTTIHQDLAARDRLVVFKRREAGSKG